MDQAIDPLPGQGLLAASDGVGLAWDRLVPARRPEAMAGVVLLVHGYGEHRGRLASLRQSLRDAGYVTMAADLRGHGRSGGPRGHVRRFSDYLGDLQLLREEAQRLHPGLPCVLAGHSLGGLIVLHEALTRPAGLAGVIAASPLLGMTRPGNLAARGLLAGLAALLPACELRFGLDPERPLASPAAVAAFAADPWCSAALTPGWWATARQAMAELPGRARAWGALPLLLLVGGEDPLLDRSALARFVAAVESGGGGPEASPLSLQQLSGLRHELWQEGPPGGDAARVATVAWLAARLGRIGRPALTPIPAGPTPWGSGVR